MSKKLAALQKDIAEAKSEVDRAGAVLERQVEEDSALVDELGIGTFRMLDGKYQEDALRFWQMNIQTKEKATIEEIKAKREERQTIELRKEVIPQEIADAKINLKDISSEAEESTRKLDEFRAAENSVKSVMEKYGLDCELRFTSTAKDYLDEQIAATKASVEDESRRIETTEEALAAVKRGTLHIPKLLSEYLDSTGLRYTTFEKYLLTQTGKGLLSADDCQKILVRYPYAAYGVIVEETDRELLYQEADGKWLPAVLPVFTASDVDKLLSNETEVFSVVAAYSREYFRDRSAYEIGLKDTLKKQNEHKELLKERERLLSDDAAVVNSFAVYDNAWESQTVSEIDKLKKNADEVQKHITALQTECDGLKEKIVLVQEEEDGLDAELRDIQGKLSGFEKLLAKLHEEDERSNALKEAQKALGELRDHEKRLSLQKNDKESESKQLQARLTELTSFEKTLQEGYSIVAEADEAEPISDAWDNLLSQYKTLLEKQNAGLRDLMEEKNRLSEESRDKQKEIQKRNCNKEDYEQIVYTDEAEAEAIKNCQTTEKLSKEAAEECIKAGRAQAKAESAFESSAKKLADFGGEALPMSEVGMAFDARIAEIKSKLAELEEKEKELSDILLKLQKAQGKAENATESYSRPVQYNSIELENDYIAQLTALTKQIRERQNFVSSSERKVGESLKKMAEIYGDASSDVNLAISSMQELLSNASVRGDRYYTLCEHIDANMHTAKLRISQIDTDLKEFHKTKDDLIHQCVLQGKQIYEGLMQLSNNSKVMVQGRRRQMLKFDIPDAIDENVAKVNISAEIDKGTGEIVARMADDAYAESDIRKTATATVGSRRLLRRYINADNIVLKAYKIDRNPDNSGYRTWEQTQVNNSGAEKFVVYFAVILALMAYTRDGYDDMGGENKSVLILDNPFGPISSKHVLEPMFEISGNYNVQMICLSDISKSDIVSCFDLVIRAVVKQLALSNKEQLTHEGNEIIEHGFYRAEQMNLF